MPKSKTKKSSRRVTANLPALLAVGIILTSMGMLAATTSSEIVQNLCLVASSIGVLVIGVVIGLGLAGRSNDW